MKAREIARQRFAQEKRARDARKAEREEYRKYLKSPWRIAEVSTLMLVTLLIITGLAYFAPAKDKRMSAPNHQITQSHK